MTPRHTIEFRPTSRSLIGDRCPWQSKFLDNGHFNLKLETFLWRTSLNMVTILNIYSKLRDKIQLNFKIVSGNVSGTSLELMRVVPYGWIWNRYPGPGRNRPSLGEKSYARQANMHYTQRKSFKCLLCLNASCRFHICRIGWLVYAT